MYACFLGGDLEKHIFWGQCEKNGRNSTGKLVISIPVYVKKKSLNFWVEAKSSWGIKGTQHHKKNSKHNKTLEILEKHSNSILWKKKIEYLRIIK